MGLEPEEVQEYLYNCWPTLRRELNTSAWRDEKQIVSDTVQRSSYQSNDTWILTMTGDSVSFKTLQDREKKRG